MMLCPVCDAKGYVLGLGGMREICGKCDGARHVAVEFVAPPATPTTTVSFAEPVKAKTKANTKAKTKVDKRTKQYKQSKK